MPIDDGYVPTDEELEAQALQDWLRQLEEESGTPGGEGEIVEDIQEHVKSLEVKQEFENNKQEARKAHLNIKDKFGEDVKGSDETFLSTIRRRKDYKRNRSYLVDRILPEGRLHMLVGDSGVGKSRWMYSNFIRAYSEGQDILGFKSHPKPYLYITCDRSIDSMGETLESMGLGDWDISAISVMELGKKFNVAKNGTELWVPDLAALPGLFPHVKLFIVEGTGIFQGKGGKSNLNDYYGSSRFWYPIIESFALTGSTLFCTQHPPKGLVTGEKFQGRNMIMGTQATPGMFDTVMTMHMEKDKRRVLTLCNRQMEDLTYEYVMQDGMLIPVTEEIKAELEVANTSPQREELEGFVKDIASQTDFFSAKVIETWATGDGRNISRATVRRWLDQMVEKGRFKQAGSRGQYSYVRKVVKIS